MVHLAKDQTLGGAGLRGMRWCIKCCSTVAVVSTGWAVAWNHTDPSMKVPTTTDPMSCHQSLGELHLLSPETWLRRSCSRCGRAHHVQLAPDGML